MTHLPNPVRRSAGALPLLATLVAAVATAANAQVTLRVPAQFATVQAAIDAAPPGATVLIAPGTYAVTNLDPGGREITIRGEFGAPQTVLDGGLQGRIVHVRNHEGQGLRFEGLTFRRGVAPLNGRGGAIRIDGFATPRIVDCIFEQNTSTLGGAAVEIAESAGVVVTGCTFAANAGGAFWALTDGNLALTGCTFTQNTDSVLFYAKGLLRGRLQLEDCAFDANTPTSRVVDLQDISATLCRCTFRNNVVPTSCIRCRPTAPFQKFELADCTLSNNRCDRSVCDLTGWGLAAIDGVPATFTNCTFADNTLATGNARSCLWIRGHNARFDRCSFERNTAPGAFAIARVEGLVGPSGNSRFAMSRCRVLDNTTAAHSMMLLTGVVAKIDNCLFARNRSDTGPSVLYVNQGTAANVAFCTFTANHAMNAPSGTGGAVHDVPDLNSSIVYGNSPLQIQGTMTAATYCDVEGGFPGTGNFDADPRLIPSGPRAFRLDVGSPCVDAGAPGMPMSTHDLDGQPRRLGLAADVGCDESLAQPLPGTDGDLLLTTTLDGQGDPLAAAKQAQVGQRLELLVRSLTGRTVGAWTLTAGELRPTGAPQPSVVVVPGLHLDLFSPGFFLIFDSLAIHSPLRGTGLPAPGLALSFAVPPGLSGDSVHLQTIAIDLSTGSYDASNCHEVILP